MRDDADVLGRLHATLVEEIVARYPQYLDAPFTVAEIYQNLVPYGTHRDQIGVEMNGDYEHALLRILSGEGEFLVIDSEPVVRALQEELESSNPNTGLFREFAAADVRLNPDRLSPDVYASPPITAEPEATEHPDPDEGQASWAVPVGDLAPPGEAAAVPAEGSEPPGTCRWCRAELPSRARLNFCPFCGTDVNVVPCPGCGEELEPDWRFCVSCGTEVSG
jgi:hypothetical protein